MSKLEHFRSTLIALTAIALLSSSLIFAQTASKAPEAKPLTPAAWEIEHERLLHMDWSDSEHFRAANAALPAPAPGEHRVVMMGDSITQAWRETGAPNGEMGSFFVGKPYINRGISGQTTPQMLVRFRQDVIDLKPAVVVILAGTNDLAENTGPVTLEFIEGNLASMSELARAHGIKVILCSVMPVLDYSWRKGLHPAPKVVALNRWIRAYAAENQFTYLDYYTPTATPEGGMKPELSPDGVHPNHAGYEIMAHLLGQAVDATVK